MVEQVGESLMRQRAAVLLSCSVSSRSRVPTDGVRMNDDGFEHHHCRQQSWENDLNNGLLRLSMGGLMFGGTAALETRFKRVTDKRVTC